MTTFAELIEELEIEGRLLEPDAKKFPRLNLFEMRMRVSGAWRGFYAYIDDREIIVLSFLHKQSQKAPKLEIEKALRRLKSHT